MMVIECHSVEETQSFAAKLSQKFPVGSVVALIGNLGTGKTTFTQGFAKGLGINEHVGSPTFKLVSEYEGDSHNLYHIDCYRLENSTDFLNIGGEAFLAPETGVTLMEWAEIIGDILPEETMTIRFSRIEGKPESRQIKVEGIDGKR